MKRWIAAALLLIWFVSMVGRIETGSEEERVRQLETALRRGAVACYATEGAYPPNLEYLQTHYGIQIDEEQYTVFYQVFAENIMPQITVLQRGT